MLMLLVENLQGNRAVWTRGVVRPVHRRVSAVAQRCLHDVALEPVAGRKHPHSLGVCCRSAPAEKGQVSRYFGTCRVRRGASVVPCLRPAETPPPSGSPPGRRPCGSRARSISTWLSATVATTAITS